MGYFSDQEIQNQTEVGDRAQSQDQVANWYFSQRRTDNVLLREIMNDDKLRERVARNMAKQPNPRPRYRRGKGNPAHIVLMRKDYHLLLSAVITYTVISIAFLVWVASA
jgi:hypothetical protein